MVCAVATAELEEEVPADDEKSMNVDPGAATDASAAKKKKKKKKSGKKADHASEVDDERAEPSAGTEQAAAGVDVLSSVLGHLKNLELRQKTMVEPSKRVYRFWKTQPVPQYGLIHLWARSNARKGKGGRKGVENEQYVGGKVRLAESTKYKTPRPQRLDIAEGT